MAPQSVEMVYNEPMPLSGEAKREYQRRWVAKRRQDWIDSQGGCCAKCGSVDRLEVDHIDRSTKKYRPADIWSRSAKVREEELAKCQVLCYDHHLEKSISEGPEWKGVAEHGTHSMYAQGCRCADCKSAHTALAKEYRASGRKW